MPYFVGIFPYIGLIQALYMLGTSNLGSWNGHSPYWIATSTTSYFLDVQISSKKHHPLATGCTWNHRSADNPTEHGFGIWWWYQLWFILLQADWIQWILQVQGVPYGAPKSQMSIEIVVELLNKNLADSPYKDVILKSGRKISCVQFSINQQSRSCH
jgi:hypothetical protein